MAAVIHDRTEVNSQLFECEYSWFSQSYVKLHGVEVNYWSDRISNLNTPSVALGAFLPFLYIKYSKLYMKNLINRLIDHGNCELQPCLLQKYLLHCFHD